eukprot:TRINITY_DN3541_c0_g5_i3.p1 TRINITY_DN3541_c0_g5~~TRINITY_DN3541_c0_g5_i3.p1  ORF type:complete len:378 (+),score=45.93 TRINITY_DN3541_c0_g5_i3:241-1374(+)
MTKDPVFGFYFIVKKTDDHQEIKQMQIPCQTAKVDTVNFKQLDESCPKTISVSIGQRQDLGFGSPGLYFVYFANCQKESSVSLKMHLNFNNQETNNLSAGDIPLPMIYTLLSIIYFGIIIYWIFGFIRKPRDPSVIHRVNTIHYLMTIFIIVKFLTLVCSASEYYNLQLYGRPRGWNVAYYIFSFLKGVMLFTVILLIGTGWSFLKPFLSDKDKKVFMVVVPLQLLANIALIVVDESTPSSISFVTWYELFQLIDIICCGAILIPIIWSIKHLKEASETDGKAALNMNKLRLFRQFYLTVVAYVYFTRIVIMLLSRTVRFDLLWICVILTEFAALLLFTTTGYSFRPTADNPYFKLSHDDDGNEGIQMKEMKSEEEP